MTELRCQHCEHEWDYSGSGLYATCPHCYYKVKVEDHRLDTDESGAEADS